MNKRADLSRINEAVEMRQQENQDEHPILSRLVVLRVALNHEFGEAFADFDHELAQIESALFGELEWPLCNCAGGPQEEGLVSIPHEPHCPLAVREGR